MNKKLTANQQKFADEYIKSGNASEAYKLAGYKVKSDKAVRANASRLLTNANIRSYIDKQMAEIESNKIMDAKEAMEFLTGIVRGEQMETKVVTTAYDVEKVKVPADLKTKISAVKEIMKRYPGDDRLLQAQVDKLEAEARILKSRADEVDNNSGVNEQVIIVDDIKNSKVNDDDNH